MPSHAPILVDAHVHGHGCFRRDDVFASARRNFLDARRALGLETSAADVLLLTEAAGEDFYERCRGDADSPSRGEWSVRTTGEPDSLLVLHEGEHRLTLVAGRQLVSDVDLELLAIGTTEPLPDRAPLERQLAAIHGKEALAIVPWGFGKWWFSRGRHVGALIDSADPATTFLGDNGGRLGLSPEPGLFERARRRGMRILPGSDPLPFPGQVSRIGTHGFVLDARLDPLAPARGLKTALRGGTTQPPTFGRGQRLAPFAVSQLRMQWLKRARRGGRP